MVKDVRLVSSNNAPHEINLAINALKSKEYIWWRTGSKKWQTEGLAVRTRGDSSTIFGILSAEGCLRGDEIDSYDFSNHRIDSWKQIAELDQVYFKVTDAYKVYISRADLIRSNGEKITDGRQMRDGLRLVIN